MGAYTQKLRKRIQTYGPKIGYCVICGAYGRLTVDHVPPKSCENISDHVLRPFLEYTNAPSRRSTSQAGVKFKTLCGKCNNDRLGQKFDPALASFVNEILGYVRTCKEGSLAVPDDQLIFVKPHKIARAVVGHYLAANSVEEAKTGLISSEYYDLLREYFLDETKALPGPIDILYWLYPYREKVVHKYIGRIIAHGKQVSGGVIKFMPVGFWIVMTNTFNGDLGVQNLVNDRGADINSTDQILIGKSMIMANGFPETPNDTGASMMDIDSSYLASENLR